MQNTVLTLHYTNILQVHYLFFLHHNAQKKLGPSWSWSYGINLQLPLQSVTITTKVVSSNPVHGVYSIQHYVMKFVSDLQQVSDFLRVIQSHYVTDCTEQSQWVITLRHWLYWTITVSYHTTSLTVLNNHSELSHYVTVT
jgi:hypothetical protein